MAAGQQGNGEKLVKALPRVKAPFGQISFQRTECNKAPDQTPLAGFTRWYVAVPSLPRERAGTTLSGRLP